jgi:hypothetical protein
MLPLLQYALTELYTNRTGRVIASSEYQEMGGLSGTLSGRAEELLVDLGPANEAAVRRLFTQLVTPGEGAEDTRRRALVSELAGVPEIVFEVFSKARLITFDRDPVTREPTVEVAHEALIREWPRLRRWVEEDREDLRVLSHLTATARTWLERDRDPDELYRGARLAAGAALDTDEQLATLLALEARRLTDEETSAADQAVLSALTAIPVGSLASRSGRAWSGRWPSAATAALSWRPAAHRWR